MKIHPSLSRLLRIGLVLLLCLAAGWCALLAARLESAPPAVTPMIAPALVPFMALPLIFLGPPAAGRPPGNAGQRPALPRHQFLAP